MNHVYEIPLFKIYENFQMTLSRSCKNMLQNFVQRVQIKYENQKFRTRNFLLKLIIIYVFISNNVEFSLILLLIKMLSVQQMQNNKILTFCSFIGLLFFIITVSFLIVLVSKPNYQPQLPLLMFLTPFSAFLFLFCMLRFKYEQNKKNQQLLQGYVVDQIIISQQQPQQWPQESTPYYPNLNTQQHSNLNNQPQQNVYPNLYCQPSNFNYPAQEQTNNMNTNQQFYQQYPNVPQQNTNLNNQQQSNQFY